MRRLALRRVAVSSPKVQVSVVVSKNGPYLVSGPASLAEEVIVANTEGESLQWQRGETYAVPEKYALCRCGHSHTPPFCDGTHAKIGFDGTETAARTPYAAQAKVFDGPQLSLLDARHLCADARFCDPNGKVWNQVTHTDDPNVRDMFLRQVHHCPAGRLVAFDKAAGKPIEQDAPVAIGLIEDPVQDCSGPIWLRGGVALTSADGHQYEVRSNMTVCRCGASNNKPYCDGSHASIRFKTKKT
jgi:CDGSH-type Zn-finger protein